MKVLKILQYLVSLGHLIIQILLYRGWSNGFDALASKIPSTAPEMASTVLSGTFVELSRHSFTFVMLSIFTLAFYLTVTAHISLWNGETILEETISEAIHKQFPEKEEKARG
ncbi:MAG: hypothetical protein K8T10_06745 [Candidatus Eremiobacteraeota bacterium]|nr:hypothetical protein [Candidatus Eremiobacteraeota bacterium]